MEGQGKMDQMRGVQGQKNNQPPPSKKKKSEEEEKDGKTTNENSGAKGN